MAPTLVAPASTITDADFVLGQYRQDGLTAAGGQVVREEASVADDHRQSQWALER